MPGSGRADSEPRPLECPAVLPGESLNQASSPSYKLSAGVG